MGASSLASPHSLWCSSLTTQGPVQRQGLSSCTGRQLGRSHGEGPLLPGLPGVWNLSLVWNSRPCLGWEADVSAGSSCASTPEFPSSGLFSQDFRSPVLSYSMPPAAVDNICCQNSSPGLWSWTWPLSCQWSQVSASQQMMAGKTSCRAWGPSLHNMEVNLPLITLPTESVLSCPGFHEDGTHCP